MNIDERIRDQLRADTDPADTAADEKSLFGMLFRVFTGGLRRWAVFAMALTLVFVGLTVWCGYEFFTAASVDGRVFWGVLAVVAFHAVTMLKLWFFMEMNRNSMIREVKRVEIALMRLDQERTAQQ